VRGRAAIVIDEVPYQVNKANLVEQIAGLVRSKHVEGIHDIRDESSRGEIRVVIELKKDAQQEVILAHLLKHTRMQVTCSMNHICLVNGVPRVLVLRDFLQHFLDHRLDVVTRRTQYELTKAQKRAHILLGLKVAIDNLDNTIKIVRAASESKEAKENLIARFSFILSQTS
jgi:DNA gyrase subunit A